MTWLNSKNTHINKTVEQGISMCMHDRIKKEIESFRKAYGEYPKNVYLGRYEMKQLRQWACENGYTFSANFDIEGDGRPEVSGKFCFEVNDENHFKVA